MNETQRLDIWLWHARLRRVRAECARLVAAGAVRINRRPTDKPHALVRPGDVLTIALGEADERPDGRIGGQVRVLRVKTLATRRGPATEARTLYEEVPVAET